jgi:ribosome-associated protein
MTTTTVKTPGLEGKKDVQKLQRAIIDGLEDVKAQDIVVFDTEHITSLFERVIVASGTSNRQTKALAASVRDAVRDAGFSKPRIEGEENGEWIIVDCGAAVAHIMQPTIRQYYNLEELWGDKPIKLKLGAPAPLAKASKPEPVAEVKPVKSRAGAKAKPAAKSTRAAKPVDADAAEAKPAKKTIRTDDGTYVGRVGKTNDWTAKRNATEPAAEPAPAKPVRARAASKTAVKTVSEAATKVAAAKPAAAKRAPAKRTSAATAAEPVAAKPVAAKKAPAKKAAVKTPVLVIPDTKKVAARKTAVKTAVKAAAKKVAAKKAAVKKTTPRSE